jgi:histidinol phosphatase-like enzyme
MFFRAAVDYNVDLGSSVYIGDDVRDMEAARNAGLQGVFVGNSDASLGDLCVPTFHNLMASSDFLKNFYRDNK